MDFLNQLSKRTVPLFLAMVSLVVTLLACGQTATSSPTLTPDYPAATVAALATENAHLMTQVAELATVSARRATQVVAQGTKSAYMVTRVAELVTMSAHQATRVAAQEEMISYLATRVGALPLPTKAPIPTMTPYHPVRGSVEIEGGSCCVGGIAGETIEVDVAFEATSPFAEVTEMRTRAGGIRFTESSMAGAEWEPFTPLKTYPIQVVINWVGFYVSVQYRDAQGNLSPVYYDDISVEGQPSSP